MDSGILDLLEDRFALVLKPSSCRYQIRVSLWIPGLDVLIEEVDDERDWDGEARGVEADGAFGGGGRRGQGSAGSCGAARTRTPAGRRTEARRSVMAGPHPLLTCHPYGAVRNCNKRNVATTIRYSVIIKLILFKPHLLTCYCIYLGGKETAYEMDLPVSTYL